MSSAIKTSVTVASFIYIYDSPWYNCNGWLGIKHQVTYLHVYHIHKCIILIVVNRYWFHITRQHQTIIINVQMGEKNPASDCPLQALHKRYIITMSKYFCFLSAPPPLHPPPCPSKWYKLFRLKQMQTMLHFSRRSTCNQAVLALHDEMEGWGCSSLGWALLGPARLTKSQLPGTASFFSS